MCGLAAIVGKAASVEKVTYMVDSMKHRGIRYKVSEISEDVVFGHARLPIQGLDEKFDQPFHYEHWTILFVGEIFNFRDFDYEAESDVEVLAKMWHDMGIQAFTMFDGFWSVVIHDDLTGNVHIITDYLAKKPLYIAHKEDGLYISSEIKGLLASGDLSQIPDALFSSATSKWGYFFDGYNTSYQNVSKVPPCQHYMITHDGRMVADAYMELKPDHGVDIADAIYASVENRLISDVPISMLLSGGLDSSIIYRIIKDIGEDVKAFYVKNEGDSVDRLVDDLGVSELTVIDLDDGNFDLDEILYYNESPFDLGSMIPQFLLGRAIKAQGYQVALSGDGADELFGGYRRSWIYDSQYSDVFQELVYYHLPRLDKLMMAHTVELRSPFLAKDVVQGALALPREERINKNFLRTTFSRVLPNNIIAGLKQPLKVDAVRNDQQTWTLKLVERFKGIRYGNHRNWDIVL